MYCMYSLFILSINCTAENIVKLNQGHVSLATSLSKPKFVQQQSAAAVQLCIPTSTKGVGRIPYINTQSKFMQSQLLQVF